MLKYIFKKASYINRENGTLNYLFSSLLLGQIVISITCPYEMIKSYCTFFMVIIYPLLILQYLERILYNDFKDGTLELMLTIVTPLQFIISQYCAQYLLLLLSYLFALPIIIILLNYNISEIILYSSLVLINITTANIIAIFSSISFCYIKTITMVNFVLILPLALPTLIISSLIIQDITYLVLVKLLLGLVIILFTILCFASEYLLRNIYNT